MRKNSLALISVIMSVYNEKDEWLKESIESILNQTYTNIEFIIIVDNPTNVQAIELIKTYSKMDKRLKYFVNEQNQGLIFSLNRALQYTKGEYIARMDADDISHLNRLEKQLLYLKNKELDLIGSNINLFNDKSGIFYTTNKLLTHKYIKKLLKAGTIGIVHPTFFAKKEVYESVGGYHQAWHVEDKDFLARVICQGFKVGNIKDVLLDCRYNNQSVTKTNAIYIKKIGSYVTRQFSKCLKSGEYIFDENYMSNLIISEEEKDSFNKKQIFMAKARESLNKKEYIEFIIFIMKAFMSSKSTISNIKINLIFKLFKFLENIELRVKNA